MIKVKAAHAFIHGEHNLNRGDEVEISESLAGDLEKRGLVTLPATKKAPAPENKMAAAPANKAASKEVKAAK